MLKPLIMNHFTYELPFYYPNEDSPGMGFETNKSREYSREIPREYSHRDLPARAYNICGHEATEAGEACSATCAVARRAHVHELLPHAPSFFAKRPRPLADTVALARSISDPERRAHGTRWLVPSAARALGSPERSPVD